MPSSRELFQQAYKADQQKKYVDAIELYRQALVIDPQYSMAWNNLGWILYDQQQKFEEAEECYKKALKYDDRNYPAWNNLGIVYYRQKKNYKKAEKCWKKAVKLYPEFWEVWNNLKVLYKFQLANPKKAKECAMMVDRIKREEDDYREDTPKENMQKCPECGKNLERNQKICDVCGRPSLIL
jgi:tetratricopeptide (TPR) repeat protein